MRILKLKPLHAPHVLAWRSCQWENLRRVVEETCLERRTEACGVNFVYSENLFLHFFVVAMTRVTTVSRQRATVLIYGQFQRTVKDQIVESRDATVGPYSQRKLSVRTLTTRYSLQFSKLQMQTSKFELNQPPATIVPAIVWCHFLFKIFVWGFLERNINDWNSKILCLLDTVFRHLESQYLAFIFHFIFFHYGHF